MFVGYGRCEFAVTYPHDTASLYRFCPSGPEFAVSLPSPFGSLQISLRLANGLHQLAHKGFSPSGLIHLSMPWLMPGARVPLPPTFSPHGSRFPFQGGATSAAAVVIG